MKVTKVNFPKILSTESVSANTDFYILKQITGIQYDNI
jgi:hypothetical protein